MPATPIQSPAAFVPTRATAFADVDGTAISVSSAQPLPVALAAGGGALAVSNFPATQTVSGSVAVANFPATQTVSGNLSVANFPANQVVSGLIADSNSAAFLGEVALTPGTADSTARRSLKVTCTVAGNVAVIYADGSSGVWPVTIGVQTLPIAITTVVIAGTTATATYANLK